MTEVFLDQQVAIVRTSVPQPASNNRHHFQMHMVDCIAPLPLAVKELSMLEHAARPRVPGLLPALADDGDDDVD